MTAREYEKRVNRITNGEGVHANITDKHLELIQLWNDQLKLDGKSPATRSDYISKTSHFLRHSNVGGQDMEDVGKKEINSYLADRGTVYSYKAPLRQFFLWFYTDHKGVAEDEVPRFVEKQLKAAPPRKGKVKAEDVPKKEEVKTLMAGAKNNRDRALIALLADKGMRISEALGLNVGDVYFDKAGIYVMVPEAKKKYESYRKNRLTFSRTALKDWLDVHPHQDNGRVPEDAPLFVNMQRRYKCQDCGNCGEHGNVCSDCGGNIEVSFPRMLYDTARTMMANLRKEQDVREHITLHKFRHYSATNDLKDKHLKERYIVKEHGWDDPSMLDRYGHLTDDEVDLARVKQMVERGELSPDVLKDMHNGNGNEEEVEIELIRCPNCGTENSPERHRCDQCNQPFTEEGANRYDELMGAVHEYMDKKGVMDEIMETVGGDTV